MVPYVPYTALQLLDEDSYEYWLEPGEMRYKVYVFEEAMQNDIATLASEVQQRSDGDMYGVVGIMEETKFTTFAAEAEEIGGM